MHKLALVVQVLLGLLFAASGLFGLLMIFGVVPTPEQPLPPAAQSFMEATFTTGFMTVIKVLELAGGLILLASAFLKRYAPLGIVILAPITANILLFHLTMTPPAEALVAVAMNLAMAFLVYHYWEHFRAVFAPHHRPAAG